jgi:hypothetical protein
MCPALWRLELTVAVAVSMKAVITHDRWARDRVTRAPDARWLDAPPSQVRT